MNDHVAGIMIVVRHVERSQRVAAPNQGDSRHELSEHRRRYYTATTSVSATLSRSGVIEYTLEHFYMNPGAHFMVSRMQRRNGRFLTRFSRMCKTDPREARVIWETPCQTVTLSIHDDRNMWNAGGHWSKDQLRIGTRVQFINVVATKNLTGGRVPSSNQETSRILPTRLSPWTHVQSGYNHALLQAHE